VKSGVVDAIRAAGGEIYGITSEPQALASRAQDDWELPFECVGDPHQEIADAARKRGWLDLRVGEVGDFFTRDTAWEVSHPKGFFQPGVIALTSKQRLLYRWQSIPTRENAGGATGRPSAEHVWESIQQTLADDADGMRRWTKRLPSLMMLTEMRRWTKRLPSTANRHHLPCFH
jgi:hypothetical protein